MHDADQRPEMEQRNADQRADPGFTENRVHDLSLRHLVDDDRRALGGNAAREPLADRNRDRELELCVQSLRRSRNERPALLVHQQHHGRVGVEEVSDALEQLVEKLLEIEVRERRLGDRLEAEEAVLRQAALLRDGRLVPAQALHQAQEPFDPSSHRRQRKMFSSAANTFVVGGTAPG